LQVANDSQDLQDDILFVHGWPTWHMLVDGHAEGTGLPLAVAETPDACDDATSFALRYPSEGWQNVSGETAHMPWPEGMSGAAVWQTHRRDQSDWSPNASRVVGVLRGWDPDAHVLIASRIDGVRTFLVECFRARWAYGNWQQRGTPSGDDWADWFEAVARIPDDLSGSE
jgi:hypothetical protein